MKSIYIIAMLGLLIAGCTPNEAKDIPDLGLVEIGLKPVYNESTRYIQINITTDNWYSGISDAYNWKDNTTRWVSEGGSFGPDKCNCPGEYYKYFKLLSFDNTSALVSFSEELVIVGEPISQPSTHNPANISTKPVCFRTRTYDAGADICLSVIRA